MISDVPVGVLLSGGLDSSSYFSKFKKAAVRNIQSFNIGFRDEEHNESHLARMLSEKLWILILYNLKTKPYIAVSYKQHISKMSP
jgi:asparagine synthetase B (glutamine-hydrolysing)